MKNRILLLLTFFLTISYVNAAEKPAKIGYVNLEYILNFLPDAKQLETDFKAFETQIKNQLQSKAIELQDKLQRFQQDYKTMTDTVKNQKEAEIQQLHGDFEKLQMESQESLTNKHLELIRPIYNKIQKSIQIVAKENKYTHILNANVNGMLVVLYAEEEYNISNLVLKNLGIDPAKAAKEAIEKAMKKDQATKSQDIGKKEAIEKAMKKSQATKPQDTGSKIQQTKPKK